MWKRCSGVALVLVGLLAAGCDVAGADQAAVEGAHGRFTFELLTPAPLAEGRVTLEVRVVDSETGLPVDGAAIAARLTMPTMGHTSDPLAAETEPGHYQVQEALVDMPGAWVLRVRVDDMGEVDEAELPLDVL